MGHPNVGKSTLFNALTGLRQRTGNWPGKTVAVSWGDVDYKGLKLRFVDLPGTYSIVGESEAEKVVEEYLETGPDVVVVVADASTLHESLYPLLQVLERGLRAVLLVNMMDEAEKMGIEIDLEKMEEALGIPVVGAVARRGEGINELLNAVLRVLRVKPKKWKRRSARERYRFIDRLLSKCVRGKPERREAIDRLLFHPLFDLPLIFLTFLALLLPVFYVASLTESIIEKLAWLEVLGILGSIMEAVLAFLPMIFTFYFLFTVMEDSGILARVAAAVDSYTPFPGTGFFPLAVSFGCNVLGIPATRIIKDERYRKSVGMAVPFILCSTRISVLLFLLAYFPRAVALFLGLAIIFLMLLSTIFTSWVFAGFSRKQPLLLELPPLRAPSLKTVINLSIVRTSTFILRIALWVSIGAILGELLSSAGVFKTLPAKLAFNLFVGFFAKELTLGSLSTLFGTFDLLQILSFRGAVAFLLFYSFYTPCLPTVAAIAGEFGKKQALISILWSLLIASVFALIPFLIF